MRIGYPVINLELEDTPDRETMVSYAKEKIFSTIEKNLGKLLDTLDFNERNGLLYYRVRPDLVPYATHPRCQYGWDQAFAEPLREVGAFALRYGMRLTIHAPLTTALCTPSETVLKESLKDLAYQNRVMDLMGLDSTHKIQIHAGPAMGDEPGSIERLILRLNSLPSEIRRRVVLENDNVFCSLRYSLEVHAKTGIPIVLDALHHELDESGVPVEEALRRSSATWGAADGLPMVDYSSQMPKKMRGKHSEHIDLEHFAEFFARTEDFDFDLMLELKDREQSALKVIELVHEDPRLVMRVPQS